MTFKITVIHGNSAEGNVVCWWTNAYYCNHKQFLYKPYWPLQKQLYGFKFLSFCNLKISNKNCCFVTVLLTIHIINELSLSASEDVGSARCAPLQCSPQCMLVRRARAEAWIMP